MTCVSCGVALKPGAKYCGNCGARVEVSADRVAKLELAPNPLGLASCGVRIIEAKGVGPDTDGDVRFEIRFEVDNGTEQDWDHLVVRTQLLDNEGLAVDETRDTYEQTISAGEREEFHVYHRSTRGQMLAEHAERASILVSVIACGGAFHKLEELPVPENALEVAPFRTAKVGNILQVVSGCMWREEPDTDGDVFLQTAAVVQNLTPLNLHEVKLIATVTDRAGRQLTEATGYEEVRPGEICMISGSNYANVRQFNGASVAIAMLGYFAAASGFVHHHGLEIEAAVEDVDEETDGRPSVDGAAADMVDEAAQSGWHFNACWEDRGEDKFICRWFVCWKEVEGSQVVGALAGYSGGGSFEVERFYGRLQAGRLVSLWIDYTDRISGEEIDFESLDDGLRADCELALDQIWEWNDSDVWSDDDEVILSSSKRRLLQSDGDMLLLSTDSSEFLRQVCELGGLTASPAHASLSQMDETGIQALVENLEEIALDLEDKFLERGLLTRFFGSQFEFTVGIINESEENELHFSIEIKVLTERARNFDERLAEELADNIEDSFFQLVQDRHGESVKEKIQESFLSKSFILNGNVVY